MVSMRCWTAGFACLSAAILAACSNERLAIADYIAAICSAPFRSAPTEEAPFLAENVRAMTKMMIDMGIQPSGNVDRDFVSMMVPHHQGAIEMAQAQLRYGHNEQLKRLAQEIIVTQNLQHVPARERDHHQERPVGAAVTVEGGTVDAHGLDAAAGAHLVLQHGVVVLEEQPLELLLEAPADLVVVGRAHGLVLRRGRKRRQHGRERERGERAEKEATAGFRHARTSWLGRESSIRARIRAIMEA